MRPGKSNAALYTQSIKRWCVVWPLYSQSKIPFFVSPRYMYVHIGRVLVSFLRPGGKILGPGEWLKQPPLSGGLSGPITTGGGLTPGLIHRTGYPPHLRFFSSGEVLTGDLSRRFPGRVCGWRTVSARRGRSIEHPFRLKPYHVRCVWCHILRGIVPTVTFF